MDATIRQRYRRHLVEAEGVTDDEADGFLDVVGRGLDEGSPDAAALRDALEARIALSASFAGAAASLDRRAADAASARAARSALESLMQASSTRATPGRARALQDVAARALGIRPQGR